MKKIIALLLALVLCIGQIPVAGNAVSAEATAQTQSVDTDVPTALSVHDESYRTDVTLQIGEKIRLYADLSPRGAVSGIRWESSNPAAVTVDEFGWITAWDVGTAKIYATTYNGIRAACLVTVSEKLPQLQYALMADGNGYEIVGADPSIYTAHIPATYQGLPVVAIRPGAFMECENLRYFTVDKTQQTFYARDGVIFTDIPERTLVCFPPAYDAEDYYYVPQDTIAVAAYAFAGLRKLNTVTLQEGLQKLGDYAFANMQGSYNYFGSLFIYVPASLTQIGTSVLLNDSRGSAMYGPSGSAIADYARDNQIPFGYVYPFQGDPTTVELGAPAVITGSGLIPFEGEVLIHSLDYVQDYSSYEYEAIQVTVDLTALQKTHSGEVRVDMRKVWSQIVPDPTGNTALALQPQTGLYGAGYTDGEAVLRAYDRDGVLIAMQYVSGNFAFSFPGACDLGVEGGKNTTFMALPVEPVYIASSGTYSLESLQWRQNPSGDYFAYFVVQLPAPIFTMQFSMDLNLLSYSLMDIVPEGNGYAMLTIRLRDRSRAEEMDAVSLVFDAMVCIYEDEHVKCLISSQITPAEQFGPRASALAQQVKAAMLGTYLPADMPVRPITIDSSASWTPTSYQGNIQLTQWDVENFSTETIVHEMVHAVDQNMPYMDITPSTWMEGRAEYIGAILCGGTGIPAPYDWSLLTEEDKADFFYYYCYGTGRQTQYPVGHWFFYYLIENYGTEASVAITENIRGLSDYGDTQYDNYLLFKQCVEQATETGVFQHFVCEVINANGHTPVALPGVEPTCTENGLTEGVGCSFCGKALQGRQVIEATGHSYDQNNICVICGQDAIGKGLEYTLSEDGTYYIVTGIGTCVETEVVIPSTYNGLPVKEIGASAFYACASLTSITIPDSVTSIGRFAFGDCINLTEINFNATAMEDLVGTDSVFYNAGNNGDGITVNIGANVTKIPTSLFHVSWRDYAPKIVGVIFDTGSICESIGGYAFYNCNRLISINIPDSVASIGQGAFIDCNSLTNVTIPASLTSISVHAFYACASLTSITIPTGVTSIGNYAFNFCSSLTSITIPDSVTSIGVSALASCSSLTNITFEGDAPAFGSNVFYGVKATAYYPAGNDTWTAGVMQNYGGSITWKTHNTVQTSEGLEYTLSKDGTYYIVTGIGTCTDTDLVIPATYNGLPVKEIGNEAFGWGDYQITSVTLPEGITKVGAYAFASCYTLTSISLPESLVELGECAFGYCEQLRSVTIPKGLTALGYRAFIRCDSIEWFAVAEGNTAFCAVDDVLYSADMTQLHCYPAGKMAMSFEVPATITSIRSYAFASSNLAEIVLPESLLKIGEYAFEYCINLQDITLPSSLTTISSGAFFGCTFTTITIPANVEFISNGVFESCQNLMEILVDADNQKYCSQNGVLYSRDMTVLHTYPAGKTDTAFEIPKGVTKLMNNAFEGCTYLRDVRIPVSVTTIGNSAFSGCSNMQSVDLPAGVTTIEGYAFYYCENLTVVSLPGTLEYMGWDILQACWNLETIIYRGTIAQWNAIEKDERWNRLDWEGNTWDALVRYVGECKANGHTWAEATCTDPKTCVNCGEIEGEPLGHNYENGICDRCGRSNYSQGLKYTLYYKGTHYIVTGIGTCTDTELIIPDTYNGLPVAAIGDGAFIEAVHLTSIHIPAGVTQIGVSSFAGCKNLAQITVAADNLAFCAVEGILYSKDMTRLVAYAAGKADVFFEVPASVVTIDQNAFCGSKLTEVILPNGLTRLEGFTFQNCKDLTTVTIPTSVIEFGWGAFCGCSNLKKICYGGTEAEWNAITKESNWDMGTGKYTVIYLSGCAEGHIWLEATCTDPKTCVNCGETEGEPLGHNYENDVCTRCGRASYSEGLEYTLSEDGTYYIVTGIGTCTDTDIIIPATYEGVPVTTIGENVFRYCQQLASVTLPDSIVKIETYAFANSSLQNINIPAGVAFIGERAFWFCNNLTVIDIPAKTSLGSWVFAGCKSLVAINVDPASETNCSVDGVLYTKDQRYLLAYPAAKEGEFFEVPASVKIITAYAFLGNSHLREIVMPEGFERISDMVFYSCINLETITIPYSLFFIGHSAFAFCDEFVIRYAGAEEAWNTIPKDSNWSNYVGTYTIEYSINCASGHTWKDANCTMPMQCTVCGLTSGMENGHSFVDNVCTVCGVMDVDGKTVKIYYPNGDCYMTANASGDKMAPGDFDSAASWLVEIQENGCLVFIYDNMYLTTGATGNNLYLSDTLTEYAMWEMIPVDGGFYLRNWAANYRGFDQYLEVYNGNFTTYSLKENMAVCYVFQLIVECQDIVYGDADDNGEVTLKDALLLRKYMANRDLETGESTVSVGAGADANGDGVLNLKDVLLLRKYLANRDLETGESTVVLGP